MRHDTGDGFTADAAKFGVWSWSDTTTQVSRKDNLQLFYVPKNVFGGHTAKKMSEKEDLSYLRCPSCRRGRCAR